MKSSITIAGLGPSGLIVGNRQVCVIDEHPGLTDKYSISDLVSLATSTYMALTGNWGAAATAIVPVLKNTFHGKDYIAAKTDHLFIPHGGLYVINGQQRVVNDFRVVFRADSEDDVTESFGQANQGEVDKAGAGLSIRDNGEERYKNTYIRRFSIDPTKSGGTAVFSFGSGDDGWLVDVGVSSTLTVQVA